MRLFKRRGGLLADKKGNVLIMTAAAMPLLIGSAGLAVDTIQLSLLKRHLQRAADTGALAGAYAKVQGKTVSPAVNRALTFSDAFPLAATPVITEPTTGTHGGRSVRVQLSGTRTLPFWSFFGAEPTISVSATAALVYSGKYCMVALDEGTGTGIEFDGNATVNLGCGVISNTSGSAAVDVDGTTASVTASPIAAVGGVPSSSVYQQPTLLLPNSLKQEDPFADLPDPAPTNCQAKVNVASNTTYPGSLAPGCYRGMDIQGTLNLQAGGTYYVVNGPNGSDDFSVNAGAVLHGDNVTLIFTSETPTDANSYPSININGGAELQLSAPDSGTYEGVLMYYDERKPATTQGFTVNGNSNSSFEGAFYFPSQKLTFNGTADMETNCLQIVAKHVRFAGTVTINNTCDGGGGAQAFDAKWVRLIA